VDLHRHAGHPAGTFETFAEVARRHFGGTLAGRLVLTGGSAGWAARSRSRSRATAVSRCASRWTRRGRSGDATTATSTRSPTRSEDALARCAAAVQDRRALSVAVIGNCADVFPELLRRGAPVDVVTDQTSAHDALHGYVPHGMPLDEAVALRLDKPGEYVERARASMAVHCRAMVDLQAAGAGRVRLRQRPARPGAGRRRRRRVRLPGLRRRLHPPAVSARAPDRSAGRRCPATRPTSPPQTPLCSRRSRTTTRCTGGWSSRPAKVKGQGLPSRICWLGYGERHVAGEVFNDLVAGGEVTAPIVIGRDHLDAGSVASPERETEAMRDGSDAIADWPILNALLKHRLRRQLGQRAPRRRRRHRQVDPRGVVIVADGTADAARRLELTLTNDPATGVLRHADAGYETAVDHAQSVGVRIPLEPGTHAPVWQSEQPEE
jgi:urocanate hydratase